MLYYKCDKCERIFSSLGRAAQHVRTSFHLYMVQGYMKDGKFIPNCGDN